MSHPESRRDTPRESQAESQDPYQAIPSQAILSTSTGHPSTPTTSTSTPAQNTVDVDETWTLTCPCGTSKTGLDKTTATIEMLQHTRHAGSCTIEKDHGSDALPVVGAVAHVDVVLDLDAVGLSLYEAGRALEGIPFTAPERFVESTRELFAGGSYLLDQVRGQRDRIAVLEACCDSEAGRAAEAESELRATESDLAVAVREAGAFRDLAGLVELLHRPDSEGWCGQCVQHVWPCATVTAVVKTREGLAS